MLILLYIMASIAQPIMAAEKEKGVLFEENELEYPYTFWLENSHDSIDVIPSEYNEETDWDWSYYSASHISRFAKGEKGYYVRLNDYVYYCSFEKNKLVPLCNRPDCLHDKEVDYSKKKECTAYVGWGSVNLFSGIQFYEGKLYANYSINGTKSGSKYYYGDDLYEIQPDGSSREALEIDMENASRFCIHRGDVYYVTHITDSKNVTEIEQVYRKPLNGGEPEKIAEVKGSAIVDVYPYGNYIYGWCGRTDTNYLFVYDIETKDYPITEWKNIIWTFLFLGRIRMII